MKRALITGALVMFRVESLVFRVVLKLIVESFKFIRSILFISAVLMTFGSGFRFQVGLIA